MKRRKGFTLIELLNTIVILILIFFGLCRGYFASESIAIKALETHGFSEVKILDKDVWFVGFRGADIQDAAIFNVTAVNCKGKVVDGLYVCTGWPFKGATILVK